MKAAVGWLFLGGCVMALADEVLGNPPAWRFICGVMLFRVGMFIGWREWEDL